MKMPALAAAAGAAVAIWVLLVRDTIPEDARSSSDILAVVLGMVMSTMLGLLSRWRLDWRVARARQQIMRAPYVGPDGGIVAFDPAHVLTMDGVMVAAIDPERRLVRVIAPVFFGFDVVFPIDAAIHSARLTPPKLVELPPVANMPGVSSDLCVASTLFIYVQGAEDPARFTISDSEVPAAKEWLQALAGWVRDDAGWRRNLGQIPKA